MLLLMKKLYSGMPKSELVWISDVRLSFGFRIGPKPDDFVQILDVWLIDLDLLERSDFGWFY